LFRTCRPSKLSRAKQVFLSRTVREWLEHSDVRTTMIFTHVLHQGLTGVRSPLENFEPPQGGGVMRIRIRTRDKWSIGRNSLDYRRLWDIAHDH
jgi:hypothetical protein